MSQLALNVIVASLQVTKGLSAPRVLCKQAACKVKIGVCLPKWTFKSAPVVTQWRLVVQVVSDVVLVVVQRLLYLMQASTVNRVLGNSSFLEVV